MHYNPPKSEFYSLHRNFNRTLESTTLQSFTLDSTNMNDQDVFELIEALVTRKTGPNLQISLACNRISDGGANALITLLQKNNTITSINLEGNKVSQDKLNKIKELAEKNRQGRIIQELEVNESSLPQIQQNIEWNKKKKTELQNQVQEAQKQLKHPQPHLRQLRLLF